MFEPFDLDCGKSCGFKHFAGLFPARRVKMSIKIKVALKVKISTFS